jgi:hypothetical protein
MTENEFKRKLRRLFLLAKLATEIKTFNRKGVNHIRSMLLMQEYISRARSGRKKVEEVDYLKSSFYSQLRTAQSEVRLCINDLTSQRRLLVECFCLMNRAEAALLEWSDSPKVCDWLNVLLIELKTIYGVTLLYEPAMQAFCSLGAELRDWDRAASAMEVAFYASYLAGETVNQIYKTVSSKYNPPIGED